jgi:hypothetical protein
MSATVEKKKKTKAKKKEKERDENAEDERAAKLGEDRRRKPTKSTETPGKQREGSVRRERREKSEDGKKEKKEKKKEKRSGSSSTSGEFAVDAEPKKIGTLRKLVSHKPSVQFTKNEGACAVRAVRAVRFRHNTDSSLVLVRLVSISFRRRTKSVDKEKENNVSKSSNAPPPSSISELRSSDSWSVRAK